MKTLWKNKQTERQKSSFTEIFEKKLIKLNVTESEICDTQDYTVNIDPTSRECEVFLNVNR